MWHKNRKKAELLTTGEFGFPHAYQSVPPPLMTYIWYLGSSCSLVAHRRCIKSGREQTFLQLPWRGGIAQFSSLSGLRRNLIVFKIDLIWLLHNILKVACICTPRSATPCKVALVVWFEVYLCPMLFPFNKFFYWGSFFCNALISFGWKKSEKCSPENYSLHCSVFLIATSR